HPHAGDRRDARDRRARRRVHPRGPNWPGGRTGGYRAARRLPRERRIEPDDRADALHRWRREPEEVPRTLFLLRCRLMVRPFRFGVSMSTAPSREEWRQKARRAEELGYDTLVIADHLRDHFSPFSALAIAAEATKSIGLGTFVLNNDFRHPVLVARE